MTTKNKHYYKKDRFSLKSIYEVRAQIMKALNFSWTLESLKVFNESLKPKCDSVLYLFPLTDNTENTVDTSPCAIFPKNSLTFMDSNKGVINFLKEEFSAEHILAKDLLGQPGRLQRADVVIIFNSMIRLPKDCVRREGFIVTNSVKIGRNLIRHKNFIFHGYVQKNSRNAPLAYNSFGKAIASAHGFSRIIKSLEDGTVFIFRRAS